MKNYYFFYLKVVVHCLRIITVLQQMSVLLTLTSGLECVVFKLECVSKFILARSFESFID